MSDIESGRGGGGVVKEEVFRVAATQATELGETVRKQNKDKKDLARGIDVLRQLVLVGTAVVIVLLIILAIVDHPAIQFSHKHFAVGALISVCSGFAISLFLAKGSPVILIVLVVMGVGSLAFALGYVICEVRHLRG